MSTSLALAALAPGGAAHSAGESLVISELRLRGPNGVNDEFIEIANIGATAHTVASSGGTGYAIVASDGVTRCLIPNGTVIPRFGHFLCTNSVGYSLGGYAAGNGTTATGDATYATDIADNAGVALFDNNLGGGNYSLARRIDAAGTTSEANTLYREGAGLAALTPLSIDYSWSRIVTTASISASGVDNLATAGVPKDTNDNAADFLFADTNGTSAGAGQRLGAPGPENLSSPVAGHRLTVSPLDPCVNEAVAPNAVRDATPDAANNSTFGTVDIRRVITNETGSPVTRLRLRIADTRTFPAPGGIADLRARSSADLAVTVDRAPCGAGTSIVTVRGTTLEQPSSQPIGGGFNSSFGVGVVSLATPLATGESVNIRMLFGVQQVGAHSVRIIAEALPAATVSTGTPTFYCLGDAVMSSTCSPPSTNGDAYSVVANTVLNVAAPGLLANDVDAQGDPTRVATAGSAGAGHGKVSINADGSFTYLPDPGYTGVDYFGYVATDRTGASHGGAVMITVLPPTNASRFIPLPPARVFDTRAATSAPGPKGVVPAGGSIDVQVTGVAGVPASGVSAVVVNVTATGSTAPGFVTVWPTGIARPNASNVNLTAVGQTRPNLVTVPVGTGGKISMFSEGGGHLLGDIAGYYTPVANGVSAGRLVPLTPARVFDTRPATSSPGPKGLVGAGQTISAQISGVGGVPATGVAAVVLNVTATGAVNPGYVSAWPTGTAQPLASVLNLNAAGETAPNLVIVPLGTGGKVDFFTEAGTHLLADVTGYITDASAAASTSGLFVPLAPSRVFDTRPEQPGAGPKGMVGAGQSIGTQFAGVALVPVGTAAVALNLTGTGSQAAGFVTSWPTGAPRPLASTLNLGAGDTRANAAILPLSPDGEIEHFAEVPTHLLADVAGYFTA